MAAIWGVKPDEARERLRRIEWTNPANFRGRLDGSRPFPLEMPLRPPSGPEAMADFGRYTAFAEAWRAEPEQKMVRWQTVSLRNLPDQAMPTRLVIADMASLARFLGPGERRRADRIEQVLARFALLGDTSRRRAIRHFADLEALEDSSLDGIARALPQLRPGMAGGLYLRAVPIEGVDTKFLENHDALLLALLQDPDASAATPATSLAQWLGASIKPVDWVVVRPLCAQGRARLAGLPSLRAGTEGIRTLDFQARALLVVENEESIFALPEIAGVVAIGGGGRNLAWLDATWTEQMQIAYWGDIDTWGFVCLANARARRSQVESILMDAETMALHGTPVREPRPSDLNVSDWLHPHEREAYHGLLSRDCAVRYEQERLPVRVVSEAVRRWARSIGSSEVPRPSPLG